MQNGVIVHSELLLDHLKVAYPQLYFVSSTTKVLTDFSQLRRELERPEFSYVVPDFRLNKALSELNTLPQALKDKVEFLCNECCWFGCKDRRACYEAVSRKNLGETAPEHHCKAPDAKYGYRFSRAMENPGFIGIEDIQNTYLPMGFSNFKIEGRGLGSALILEFLLYYLTKPDCQLRVREKIYLDTALDLILTRLTQTNHKNTQRPGGFPLSRRILFCIISRERRSRLSCRDSSGRCIRGTRPPPSASSPPRSR